MRVAAFALVDAVVNCEGGAWGSAINSTNRTDKTCEATCDGSETRCPHGEGRTLTATATYRR